MQGQMAGKLEAYLEQHYDGTAEAERRLALEEELLAQKRSFVADDRNLGKLLMEHLRKELFSAAHKTFSEALLQLMEERGAKPSEIYQKAGITRAHFAKIKANKEYQPKKETVLAFALALHLSLEETNELLEKAGYTLSRSRLRDVVVEFFLKEHIYDVDEVNIALQERGQKPLSGGRE